MKDVDLGGDGGGELEVRLYETVWIDEHLRQSRDSEFGNLHLNIVDVCLGVLEFCRCNNWLAGS